MPNQKEYESIYKSFTATKATMKIAKTIELDIEHFCDAVSEHFFLDCIDERNREACEEHERKHHHKKKERLISISQVNVQLMPVS
jgi:hypothetical protein